MKKFKGGILNNYQNCETVSPQVSMETPLLGTLNTLVGKI